MGSICPVDPQNHPLVAPIQAQCFAEVRHGLLVFSNMVKGYSANKIEVQVFLFDKRQAASEEVAEN